MGQTMIPFPLYWPAHKLVTEAEVGRDRDMTEQAQEILFPSVSPGGLRPLYSALW